MAAVGAFAEHLFFCLLTYKRTCWQRPVQGILALVESYSADIVNRSCQRALVYGAYDYQTIKRICQNGLYVLPLEFQQDY